MTKKLPRGRCGPGPSATAGPGTGRRRRLRSGQLSTGHSLTGRLLSGTEGVAAVEFVIVLPLLLLFLFAITSFGSALFIHSNMLNAAREAARQMSVREASSLAGEVHCDQVDAAAVGFAEYVACQYLSSWGTDFVVAASDLCPVERRVEVRITTDASGAALLDVFGFFDGHTLAAEVAMRREQACV